jgi:hypothetical protein
MIGFIIAVIAGLLTPQAEAAIARPLAKALPQPLAIETGEMRALAFIVVMLIAAVLAQILDSGSVLGVMVGGALGFFGLRIFAMIKSAIDGKPSS